MSQKWIWLETKNETDTGPPKELWNQASTVYGDKVVI